VLWADTGRGWQLEGSKAIALLASRQECCTRAYVFVRQVQSEGGREGEKKETWVGASTSA